MGNPIVHWQIDVKDAPKAQKFYSELFGWKIDADNPMNYGMVSPGGKGGIDGGIGPGDEPGVTVFVQVKDLKKTLDKAKKLGGKVIMPPTRIPGFVTMATFADLEGNRIGLVKG